MLYKLYLDESGVPSPWDHSFRYFIFSGIIIKDDQSERLKAWADKIKFKYWSEIKPPSGSGIVFHSREIGRRENNFSILKNPDIEQRFYKDLFAFLYGSGFKCIIIAVDKEKAKSQGWDTKDVYQNSTKEMIKFFIEFLNKTKGRGRIIIESAGTKKDVIFYQNYISYLANGLPLLNLSHRDTKKILTSISFVSKNNYDIEAQIADLLAYPAGYKCLVNDSKKSFIANSYEEKMCEILHNKLITINSKNSFVVLPAVLPTVLPQTTD